MKQTIADTIIEILKNKRTAKLTKVDLQRLLKINKNNNDLSKILKQLLAKNRLIENKGIYSLKRAETHIGTISINRSGLGFIDFPGEEKSILVPPRFINKAINGDIVKIKIIRNDNSRGPVGKVIQVVGTSYTKLTGKVFYHNEQIFVRPLQGIIPDIKVSPAPKAMFITEGDWVEVQINKRRIGSQLDGMIIDKIEAENELVNELEATIREFDLADLYSPEMEDYAASIQPRKMERRDLREVVTLTIDPYNAKDFDDALSLHSSDDGTVVIGVHIADVAAYITPDKKLHKQVRNRSFTAYLPGRTIPMLPQVLVKDRCSLIEGKDKLAHTVMLTIDKKDGHVVKSERFHSIIKVDKRLNYEEVQKCIDENYQHPEWGDEIRKSLREIFIASRQMRQLRYNKESFLELSSSSFEIVCDYTNVVIQGIYEKKHMPSHNLVEEFMLAANVEVAKELNKKDIAGIFRIHPPPEENRLSDLSVTLFTAFQLSCNNLIHRNELNKLLKEIKNHPYEGIISFKILRTMQRALYSKDSMFHYGLGKSQYCHFTSPIRRYSDLLVHQQLWQLDTNNTLFNKKHFGDEVAHINKKEEKIDLASREINNRFKMHYFQKLFDENPSQIFEGVISEIKQKGCVVYLIHYGVYSFIAYDKFSTRYMCHENGSNFFSPVSNKRYCCGDSMKVVIGSINFRKYEVTLEPLEG